MYVPISQMNESATRTRTRRAILDAAVAVLARNPGASLGEVAAAADVGRTTLHRYFAERADLLAGLVGYANELVGEATARAELSHGSAPDALARLCREYFELGDALTLMFSGTVGNMEDEPEQPHDRELIASDRARAGRGIAGSGAVRASGCCRCCGRCSTPPGR